MPEKFTCFPTLPTELQIEVWEHVYNQPRILELGRAPRGFESEEYATPFPEMDIWRHVKLLTTRDISHGAPGALTACVLSREVGLKYYSKINPDFPFNPYIDALYFGRDFNWFWGAYILEHFVTLVKPRHIAFNLDALKISQKTFHVEVVALLGSGPEVRDIKISFVLNTPKGHSSELEEATATKGFKRVGYRELSNDKALRSVRKTFITTQKQVVESSWKWYERYGRVMYGTEKGDEMGLKDSWKIPNIKFILKDRKTRGKGRRKYH